MSTLRLLQRSVLAGFMFTGYDDGLAQAAERPPAPAKAAPAKAAPGKTPPSKVVPAKAEPAATRPQAKPQVARPLTANDVWAQDYARARAQAKALNRPILLHFHATWCGPCQQMERSVLNSSDVLKAIHCSCVAIKIDSDRYPDLIGQFGINALPCDVFVGPDGRILHVNQGAVQADQYKALISIVAHPAAAVPANVNLAHN